MNEVEITKPSHITVAITHQQATITLLNADTILGQSRIRVEDGYDLKQEEEHSLRQALMPVDTTQPVIPPWEMFTVHSDGKVLDADLQPYASFIASEGDDTNTLDWIYDELVVGDLLGHAVREKAFNGRNLTYTWLVDRSGALLLCFLDGNPVFRLQWFMDEWRVIERVWWYQPDASLTCANTTVAKQQAESVCWSCELMGLLSDVDVGTFCLTCVKSAHPHEEEHE